MQRKLINSMIKKITYMYIYIYSFRKAFSMFSKELLLSMSSTGHGNHKEDSPFLTSGDASAKRSDYYDRNLALFEV